MAIWELSRNDRSRNDRSYSYLNMLSIVRRYVRGQAPSLIYRTNIQDSNGQRRSGLRPNRGVAYRRSKAGMMQKPTLDPDVADSAQNEPALTAYDEQHVVTYIRLLQAGGDGADWREVVRVVLHMDPEREPDCARSAYQSHLARAKWVTEQGRLLRGAGST